MSEDLCRYEVRDRVALLTLNRPQRNNAWNEALGNGYFDRLDEADADPEVAVIVVTGEGKSFCPGADMEVLSGLGDGRGERAPRARPRTMTHALTVRKPLVGAINGACAGLGLVQALLLDVRFAAAGAKFTTAFARRGLIAEHSISWTLPRIVGTSVALDLLLSGRVFTAEEAKELGVVNHVVSAEEVVERAMAYAADLAHNVSPASMATIKRQVYRHLLMDVDAALADSNEVMKESLLGPDFKEGVRSFLDRRPPAFAPLGEGTQYGWFEG
jgi:enoyl-CoA hydratase/carnithine racemase